MVSWLMRGEERCYCLQSYLAGVHRGEFYNFDRTLTYTSFFETSGLTIMFPGLFDRIVSASGQPNDLAYSESRSSIFCFLGRSWILDAGRAGIVAGFVIGVPRGRWWSSFDATFGSRAQ